VNRAVRALTISPFATELLNGPCQLGSGLGHGHIATPEGVVTLTPPGSLRMPNGIETDVVVSEGERVVFGGGLLQAKRGTIAIGPVWNPKPRPRVALAIRARPRFDLAGLVGRGKGLTPLGDDILVGYLAAAALARESRSGIAFAALASSRTTALSGTLLRLAALGALPEAAHRLLVEGDPDPLLRFGASSGRGIAFGLALQGVGVVGASDALTLGLGGFELIIAKNGNDQGRLDGRHHRNQPEIARTPHDRARRPRRRGRRTGSPRVRGVAADPVSSGRRAWEADASRTLGARPRPRTPRTGSRPQVARRVRTRIA
jgi:hypothetical protein